MTLENRIQKLEQKSLSESDEWRIFIHLVPVGGPVVAWLYKDMVFPVREGESGESLDNRISAALPVEPGLYMLRGVVDVSMC